MVLITTVHLEILTRLKRTVLASMQERSQISRGRQRSRTNRRHNGPTCDTRHLDKLYVAATDLGLLLTLADHVHDSAGMTSLDNATFSPRIWSRSMDCEQLVSTFTDDIQGLVQCVGYFTHEAIRRKTEHIKLILFTDGLANAKDFDARDIVCVEDTGRIEIGFTT